MPLHQVSAQSPRAVCSGCAATALLQTPPSRPQRCVTAACAVARRHASSASPSSASASSAAPAANGAWNLVFLGAPGVGKGTFAGRVAARLRIPAISTGDIIRAEIKAGSALGASLAATTNAGGLVSDAVVTGMVRKRLAQPDAQRGFILVRARAARRAAARSSQRAASAPQPHCLHGTPPPRMRPRRPQDGYPRTVQQAEDLESIRVSASARRSRVRGFNASRARASYARMRACARAHAHAHALLRSPSSRLRCWRARRPCRAWSTSRCRSTC